MNKWSFMAHSTLRSHFKAGQLPRQWDKGWAYLPSSAEVKKPSLRRWDSIQRPVDWQSSMLPLSYAAMGLGWAKWWTKWGPLGPHCQPNLAPCESSHTWVWPQGLSGAHMGKVGPTLPPWDQWSNPHRPHMGKVGWPSWSPCWPHMGMLARNVNHNVNKPFLVNLQ
jgi:hypothetical protein